MTLDTLYKRAKSGAIQFWKTWADGSLVVSESGQLGTENPVRHKSKSEPKNVGKKNATTGVEQAKLDAASDWRKKRDEGYKSLHDLGMPTTLHNHTLEQFLDKVLPKYNTDASGNVKPMLAKAVKPGYKGVKFPCFIQPKLDGVRSLMVVTRQGPDFAVKFLSRSGKEYTTLQHIVDDVLENAPGSEPFILDGEVYSDELSFQGICKAVKKQSPESFKLKFRCYDMVSTEGQDIRLQKAYRIVDQIGSTHIQKVETFAIAGPDLIKYHHDEWVKLGYEGAMLRAMDGTYDCGQRSSSLLKVKEFDDDEFEFLSWETGEREEDLIAVLMGETSTFRAKMTGNRAEKDAMRKLDPEKITVKYFGLTNDGLPRFPIGKAIRDYE